MASRADLEFTDRESSVLWQSPIDGVEVLRARFLRHEYARHTHEASTVALMDAGAATFRYLGADFAAHPGEVFLLNADTPHTGRPASRHGYRYRVLYLHEAKLRPLFAGGDGPSRLCFRQTVLRDPTVASLLRETHAALADEALPMAGELCLLRLGRLLAARYGETPAVRGAPAHTREVLTARDYLEAHAAEKVSLRGLADVTLTSPYGLARAFSAEVGMPPHAYHTQLRVRLARRLLAAGMSVAEAAAQAGFYDQAHLSRVFKKYTGVTPRQFSLGTRVSGR
jgi:AraC-like DNA-binding protein